VDAIRLRGSLKPSLAASSRRCFALVRKRALADDWRPQEHIQGERHDARFVRHSRKPVAADRGSAGIGAGISEPAGARGGRGFRPAAPPTSSRASSRNGFPTVLGQQFYVENIGGAGGNTASGQVARLIPTATRSWQSAPAFWVNPSLYAKVPYDPVKDFAAVDAVAVSPNVVVVNPLVPAKTLPELVQLIRDNPGKYSYAGPGVGSTPHLGGEMFRLTYKLDLIHIPFTGAAPAVQATIGGHTPIAFTALPSLDGGDPGRFRWRAIGIAATERAEQLPNVPTFAEQGIKDQEADTLTGIVAPAGTPKEIRRPARARDRQKRRTARGQGAACEPRLQTGRQYARRVRRPHQAGVGKVGQGGARCHNLRIE